MKIRILGTGYGECKIKKKNTKDFRRRGGVIIDGKILIDAPHDIFDVADELGFADMFDSITDVVISHSHQGHFSRDALERLAKNKKITLYASPRVLEAAPDSENIEKVELTPLLPIDIGEHRLIPTAANHETSIDGEICLNFIVAKDKTLFYALDSGFINYGAWQLLKKIKLDAVIMDCALELSPTTEASMHHNNLSALKTVREIFTGSKILSPQGRFILSHIPTDKKRSIHDELSEAAREGGMTVAYDGYFFTV